MPVPLLQDILIVTGLSVLILLASHRLGVPSIVGLLLTGVVAGPHLLGLVHATHEVEIIAEIGVVLLLFTIGIEFSLAKLFRIRRMVLVGGGLQVLATVATGMGVGSLFGLTLGQSIFAGFLLALSSTAIVLKSLQERNEISTPSGQLSLAILIFQDIIVVPMMLLIPLLGGGGEGEVPIGPLLLRLAAVVILAGIATRWVVPWLLHQIARTRSRELFILAVVSLCLTIAWGTSAAGLSLGLGAFLAGLIISESEYSHHALGGMLPFRDVFTSLFFVSIGMLLDLGLIVDRPLEILGLVLLVLLLKGTVIAAAALVLRMSLRTAVMVGLGLSQIGEFSFVLARGGVDQGLIDETFYGLFLAASVITMAVTPLLMALARPLAARVARLPLSRRIIEGTYAPEGADGGIESLRDHLIIVGFGIGGENLARAARSSSIPYVVIETNADTVRRERNRGESTIIYGDAGNDAVLEHAGVARARVMAVLVNDPIATRSIVTLARRLNSELRIVVRTRYVREIDLLREAGASDVVPEELETSIDIFTRVLARYDVSQGEIASIADEVRRDGYALFDGTSSIPRGLFNLTFARSASTLHALGVEEGSRIVGSNAARLDLRRTYGLTLIEISRNGEVLSNPDPEVEIVAGDLLVVMGTDDDVARFCDDWSLTKLGLERSS